MNKHQTMPKAAFMKIHLHLLLISLSFAPAAAQAADPFLVENGESRAEIIIAESPARSTRLAAAELQTYVAKISGARLPIETKPSADVPVQIYVGESTHAAKFGATRMVSNTALAQILTRRGQFDEALKTLDRVNPDKLQGSWKKNILKSIEEVNEARHHAPK